tara:strand:- start:409 stop:1185 length:777 start_codon:yes stop_codon:yes gene_type:complete
MIVFTLLNRNFLFFLNKIQAQLILYCLFPLFIYLLIVAPLSNLFNIVETSGMKYSYHAISATIFACSSIFAFFTPLVLLNNDKKNKFLLYLFTTGIKPNNYFLSIILYSIICAYIEFVLSLIIFIQLSGSGSQLGVILSWWQIFYFFIITFPCVLFFSNLGLLLSNLLKSLDTILIGIIFLFLFIIFGSCSFIPIEYYPSAYGNFVNDYNIIYKLFDMFILILKNKNIGLATFVISCFLSILFYFLNLVFFKKIAENQ